MSIKETLRTDLTEAIRGRNEITSSTIRMVLTAITNEEVAGKEARVLSDDEVIVVADDTCFLSLAVMHATKNAAVASATPLAVEAKVEPVVKILK